MFKVALLAATLALAASAPRAANLELADDAPCHLVESLDLACPMRAVDANGDGMLSAAELAGFAAPSTPAFDGAPLSPPRSTGLDFKDAALDPTKVLTAKIDHDGSRRFLPALFALGALVVLLGGRPT